MSNETPESGALSVDQAIESLIAPPEEQAPEAVEAEAPEEIEAAPTAEDAPEEAETPPEEDAAEEEPPAVALEPPKYWGHEAKAKFAELPPDLQAVVLAQEGPREAAAAKAKQEAAEQVAAAEAEIAKVQKLAEGLAEVLPKAIETFQQRWGEPDWVAMAQEHGVEAMTLAKAQYEAEQKHLSQLAQAKQQADEQAHQAFLKAEEAKLAGTPLEPVETRREVAQYLIQQGYPAEQLRSVTASDLQLAHKAMLWDKAQAALKAKPATKPTPAPKAAPVKPAAAQAGSSQQRALTSVQNAFNSKPSVDNAVALLLARQGPK